MVCLSNLTVTGLFVKFDSHQSSLSILKWTLFICLHTFLCNCLHCLTLVFIDQNVLVCYFIRALCTYIYIYLYIYLFTGSIVPSWTSDCILNGRFWMPQPKALAFAVCFQRKSVFSGIITFTNLKCLNCVSFISFGTGKQTLFYSVLLACSCFSFSLILHCADISHLSF